jgi:two-component system phosphate regulon sensor histidine kinase PhoR
MTETLAAQKTGAQNTSFETNEQYSVAYLFFDADQILRTFNPKAGNLFRLDNDTIGKSAHLVRLVPGLPISSFLREAFHSSTDIEKQFRTDEGRWLQVSLYTSFLRDSKGMPTGALVTFVDVTDRISDLKDLERLNADHEAFVYTVSHDFRGPLTNMILLIDLLKAAFGSDDKKEFERLIQMMNKSAQAMKKMINEITDLGRSGAGTIEQNPRVNVENALQDVLLTLKDEIIRTQAKVESKLNVSEVAFLRKDLRSILYTLVSNAIRFSKPGQPPHIVVKTERSGDYSILSVQDFGVGMDNSGQKEVFTRFAKVPTGDDKAGIGLYIANKMISNRGGRLEVESTKGHGTIFTVYIRG